MKAFWLFAGIAAAQSSSSFYTLNRTTAGNSTSSTVFVDGRGSTISGLSVTTNAHGDPVYVTGPPFGATTTISVSAPSLNSTKTVYGSQSSSSTFGGVVSASRGSSVAQTITKVVTTTDTHVLTITKTYVYTTSAVSWNPMDMTCARQPFAASQPTQYIGLLNSTLLTLDGSPTSTMNNTLVVVAPTDVAFPVDFDVHQRQYAAQVYAWIVKSNDFGDDMMRTIFLSPLDVCRAIYAMYDWFKINQAASMLSPCGISFEQALKYVLAYEVSHNPIKSHGLLKRDALATTTTTVAVYHNPTAKVLGCGTTLTALPTRVGDVYYVANTTMAYDYAWAAAQTPVVQPPSCKKGPQRNKKQCKLDQCVLKHYKALQLTTMYRAVVMADSCPTPQPHINWITHTTSVTDVHWGTTTPGVYCAARPTVTVDRHGTSRVALVNEERPRETGARRVRCEQPPTCWDEKSCCKECRRNAEHHAWWGSWDNPWDPKTPLFWGIILSLLAILLVPCCCCCGICGRNHVRNRRRDPNSPFLSAVPFGNRFSRNQPGKVVETVTTQSGGAVDPMLAATGGAAAGSALSEKPTATTTGADAGDGRGTTRRQVEEGRGKVQFADDAAAGAGAAAGAAGQGGEQAVSAVGQGAGQAAEKGGEVVTTVAQPAEQVVTSAPEVVDAPGPHDGAFDGAGRPTGMQPADIGSMRGRKKSRPGHQLNGF